MIAALHKIPDRTLRHIRRIWHEYGVFWLGAILVGLIAVLYARLIDYGFSYFQTIRHAHAWAPLVITPALSALCVWLTRTYFRGAEGSGIPQVIATLHDNPTDLGNKLLTLKLAAGKILISFLAILGGFTIGR